MIKLYTNEKYEAFLKASDEIELGDNKVLLTQIKEFYKKISSKFENSTARYKNAVSAILDQFPISVKSGLNEKQSYLSLCFQNSKLFLPAAAIK